MKIIPLVGIDNIVFGSSRDEIKKLLGEPTTTIKHEWPDDTDTESWIYEALGLELNFGSDEDYRLTTITTSSPDATLDGVQPVGLAEEKLKELLPAVKLDDDFDENGKDYFYPEKEISFWILNDKVFNLTLFPEYDENGEEAIWPPTIH